ncbi:hypothetical protein ACLBXJ_17840 [Methylobacterium mesophilicum]|uniref:hypothetical protein n=1 Tax=Methylobacterium TaxID=407 RepID=UPI0011CA61B1|nr:MULTISPECIES: hypothetical protein [Methylobacterium]TXN48084.1 hypothetical protein FV233_02670 [Methylobacterium sp. WL7]GJE22416.1 hypothetical protein JHFBIEKO_2870 [Methylobacterium mesophilicum]
MFDRVVRMAVLSAPLLLAQPLLAKDAPAPAASEAPAAKEPAAKAPSAGQSAARERQKTCGAQWRALTDAQKTAQGPKWPQYWSSCNKRLKGGDKA